MSQSAVRLNLNLLPADVKTHLQSEWQCHVSPVFQNNAVSCYVFNDALQPNEGNCHSLCQELEFAAILPTPSLSTSVHTVSLGGGRLTEVTRSLQTTVYSPATLTHRHSQAHIQPSGPQQQPGVGNISQIIQNVLLNLIGGGLLGELTLGDSPSSHLPYCRGTTGPASWTSRDQVGVDHSHQDLHHHLHRHTDRPHTRQLQGLRDIPDGDGGGRVDQHDHGLQHTDSPQLCARH